MSYVNSDLYQTYPSTTVTSTSGSSCIIWIVLFVIFLLVAIGLAIWLLVLYLGNHVGGGNDRTISLAGAKITAEANSITGTWGAVNNPNDKVTLYISESPFVFNDSGQVINNNGAVNQDSQVGSNGKITIPAKNSTSYNAMMIVTADDTVHYRVYGPRKVFTQVQANIAGHKFNIQSLNTCNGAVSNTGTYTTMPSSYGSYSLGSVNNSNPDSTSLLVQFDEPQDTETNQVLCRPSLSTTQVAFGCWSNRDANEKPKIYSVTTKGECDLGSTPISLENCQWSYNAEPTNMTGLNQWCLSSTGSTTINSSVREPLCLAVNGSNLAVVNGQVNTDTWFNPIVK